MSTTASTTNKKRRVDTDTEPSEPEQPTKLMVRHRLITWFEEGPNPVDPAGGRVLVERIAHHGDEISIPDGPQLERLKSLNSFYTDKDRQAILAGAYRGFDAETVYQQRRGQHPVNVIEPAEGEGFQIDSLDAAELADVIRANSLNPEQTVALAGDSLESIEKVLDAENIATDNDPRPAVQSALEAKMKAATS